MMPALRVLSLWTIIALIITLSPLSHLVLALNSYATSVIGDGESYTVAGVVYAKRGKSDIFVLTLKDDESIGWSIRIGGDGEDHVHKLIKTRDGGYVLVGYTNSFGSEKNDILLVKLSPRGDVEWAKTLGGSEDDKAFDIAESPDGGYILVGSTGSFSRPGYDAIIAKLDRLGNLEWAKVFGQPYYDDTLRVVKPSRWGYLTAGETWSLRAGMSDILVLELNTSGEPLWGVIVGGGRYEGAYDFIEVEGGYILTGSSWSYWFGLDDAFVFKLNGTGNLQWFKAVGGEDYDGAHRILRHPNGYTIVGFSSSFGAGESDVMVVRFGKFEYPVWGKLIGGERDESAYSAHSTADGGVIVAGYSSSFNMAGLKEAMVFKLSSEGAVEWAFLITLSLPASAETGLTKLRGTHRIVKQRWMDWVMDVDPKVKVRDIVLRDADLTVRRIEPLVEAIGVYVRRVQLKVRNIEVRLDPLEVIQNWILSHIAFLVLVLPLIAMLLFLMVKFLAPWFMRIVKRVLQASGLGKTHLSRRLNTRFTVSLNRYAV